MEKVVRKFNTHADADRSDREYYRSLTPRQRVNIVLQLIDDYYGPQPRIAKVVRIVRRQDDPGSAPIA